MVQYFLINILQCVVLGHFKFMDSIYINSNDKSSNNDVNTEGNKSSFHRLSDLERFSDSYPDEFDCVINDTVNSKSKAIDNFQAAFQAPTPLSLNVESTIFQSSMATIPKSLELKHENSKIPKPSVYDFAISKDLLIKTTISTLIAPPKPFFILPSSFTTTRDLNDIVSLIKHTLEKEYAEIDFEFLEFDCYFRGVYVRGSRYSDFNIRIYENTGGKGYSVEFQRLHKDSCGFTFNFIFESVKRGISGSFSPTSTVDLHESQLIGDFSLIELTNSVTLSDEEISDSINQVLNMAAEPSFQSKLEACKMLCDMADDAEIRQRMAAAKCVETLIDLVNTNHILIRQYAILALAQLSECQECLQSMANKTFLPILIALITDGPYSSAAMRRECARIMANISSKKPTDVMSIIGKDSLLSWSSIVSSISDRTVRERSERTLINLQSYLK